MVLKGQPLSVWVLGSLVLAFCCLGLYVPYIEYDPAGEIDDIRGRTLCAPPNRRKWSKFIVRGTEHYWRTDFRGRDVGLRMLKRLAVFKPGPGSYCSAFGLLGAVSGYSGGPIRLIVSYVTDTLAVYLVWSFWCCSAPSSSRKL